jgi:hypothetical protein
VNRRHVAAAQGAFYAATGVWAVVGRRSFERITGFKFEGWLLKTVGLLVTASGAAMLEAARHDRVTPEIRLLAEASAVSLAAVDVVYVARRRISPVYLLDAIAEAGLVAAWHAVPDDPV